MRKWKNSLNTGDSALNRADDCRPSLAWRKRPGYRRKENDATAVFRACRATKIASLCRLAYCPQKKVASASLVQAFAGTRVTGRSTGVSKFDWPPTKGTPAMDHFHYSGRVLYCEGVPIAELAGTYGTPLFVYSKRTLLHHLHQLQRAFAAAQPLICYSIKTNPNLAICRLMRENGTGFDVTSGGELYPRFASRRCSRPDCFRRRRQNRPGDA
jgi:hypothetical protein